jgi:hypothetical protein
MPMRGGKGGKRRNRDDYEDDYQPHRGMDVYDVYFKSFLNIVI